MKGKSLIHFTRAESIRSGVFSKSVAYLNSMEVTYRHSTLSRLLQIPSRGNHQSILIVIAIPFSSNGLGSAKNVYKAQGVALGLHGDGALPLPMQRTDTSSHHEQVGKPILDSPLLIRLPILFKRKDPGPECSGPHNKPHTVTDTERGFPKLAIAASGYSMHSNEKALRPPEPR